MFSPDLTKSQLVEIIEGMSDLDFARFRYCQEMSGAYLAVAMFEDRLITAMHMCDRVRLAETLGDDADRWAQYLSKRALLQESTLGSLIKILEKHAIAPVDVAYLRWIKDKRDYFVHRLFHEVGWPGELDADGCHYMTRRLIAIQLWLGRAERNIWAIFERAGFVQLARFDEGVLVANLGFFDQSGDVEERSGAG